MEHQANCHSRWGLQGYLKIYNILIHTCTVYIRQLRPITNLDKSTWTKPGFFHFIKRQRNSFKGKMLSCKRKIGMLSVHVTAYVLLASGESPKQFYVQVWCADHAIIYIKARNTKGLLTAWNGISRISWFQRKPFVVGKLSPEQTRKHCCGNMFPVIVSLLQSFPVKTMFQDYSANINST